MPEVGQVRHELRRVPEREAGVELQPVRRARRSAGRGSFSHLLQDPLIERDDEISRYGLGQEVFSGRSLRPNVASERYYQVWGRDESASSPQRAKDRKLWRCIERG